jgi:hypothetical protein
MRHIVHKVRKKSNPKKTNLWGNGEGGKWGNRYTLGVEKSHFRVSEIDIKPGI